MCDFKNRESSMVVVKRDDEGNPTVWCDPCLETIVGSLNEFEITTVASCCGHGRGPGSIALKDGRVLIVSKDIDEFKMIEGMLKFDKNDLSSFWVDEETPYIHENVVNTLIQGKVKEAKSVASWKSETDRLVREAQREMIQRVKDVLPKKMIPESVPHHNPYLTGYNTSLKEVDEVLRKIEETIG